MMSRRGSSSRRRHGESAGAGPPREDGSSRDKDHLEKLDRRLDREEVVAAEDLHSLLIFAWTGLSISLQAIRTGIDVCA